MVERPKMRYVDAFPIESDGQKLIYLKDPEDLVEQSLAVPYHVYFLLTWCLCLKHNSSQLRFI